MDERFREAIIKSGGCPASTVEVGCEMGITSFLMHCEKRIFLDFDSSIIEKVKLAHETLCPEYIQDEFIVGDMFSMPLSDDMVDIAFNSGVLEHYDQEHIVLALKEMSRVTKPGGYLVIGIPNHYCTVYRMAYLRGMLLDRLHIRTWPWPKEIKYYDLKEEIMTAGLQLMERKTLSHDSIWNWWGGNKYMLPRTVFKMRDRIKPFEGYLTVLIIQNCK